MPKSLKNVGGACGPRQQSGSPRKGGSHITDLCSIREVSHTPRDSVVAGEESHFYPTALTMARLLRILIIAYKWTLSPLLGWLGGPGSGCRFHPTCSVYLLQAVERHGIWRGGWLGLKRLARCHPWGGQGEDPVPKSFGECGRELCVPTVAAQRQVPPYQLSHSRHRAAGLACE